jgi:hypothetical protein
MGYQMVSPYLVVRLLSQWVVIVVPCAMFEPAVYCIHVRGMYNTSVALSHTTETVGVMARKGIYFMTRKRIYFPLKLEDTLFFYGEKENFFLF